MAGTIILLFSAFVSIIAITLVFFIFNKVYQENYKKPWLYIAFSTIFLVISQILRFLEAFYSFTITNTSVTEYVIHLLEFISITILAYALLLEYLILKYYKGKFIKMKFIPVQEGTLGGELDINVTPGNTYLAVKKDRKFLLNQFSQATKKGFEGFLLTEENPKDSRVKLEIYKTPIAWINQLDTELNASSKKDYLDENSGIVDPIQLNNIISYIDLFLEQSSNPFVYIDLNLILKINSFAISQEFLKYIKSKIERYNGVLLCSINTDVLKPSEIAELYSFMLELE